MATMVKNLDNGDMADTAILTPLAMDAPAQTAGTSAAPRYYIIWQNAQGRTKKMWAWPTASERNNILTTITDAIDGDDSYVEIQGS